jgi:hypothetical protein
MVLTKGQVSLLLRKARLIEQQYLTGGASDYALLTDVPSQNLARLRRQLRLAAQNNWMAAAKQLKREYFGQLIRLQTTLADVIDCNSAHREQHLVSGLTDIFRDLVVLQREFDGFSFDKAGMLLSVTTEPIELDGIYLGAFEICLDLKTVNRKEPGSYEVIAVDPHPATRSDSITHPHVQDDQLCEGDASHAIRNALRQGRLLDFFQLVANVLQTYNSGSPYRSLEEWEGERCSDCGSSIDVEDCYCCEACGDRLCDNCQSCCIECSEHYCANCSNVCTACLDDVCKYCVKHDADDDENYCPECLKKKERCASCVTNENQQQDQIQNEESANSDSHVAVHPDSVGQVAVSA